MILIDTDIMVDVLRRYEPAVAWLDSLGTALIGIPGLVAMELLQSCRDRDEKQQVEALLRPYTLYWPSPLDCARAFEGFSSHHLSHGLGILDALIAETAVGHEAQLATFNEKHYRIVEALSTIQPYART